MLTGRQLKAARALLGLQRSKLAERMSIPTKIIRIAESVDDECSVTVARAQRIQDYLERQGIAILPTGQRWQISVKVVFLTRYDRNLPIKGKYNLRKLNCRC